MVGSACCLGGRCTDRRGQLGVRGQPRGAGRAVTLRRVEVGTQVVLPARRQESQQTVATEERARRTRPRRQPPPCAITPKVIQRLAQQVAAEIPGDGVEHAFAPQLIATGRAVELERRAAVLGLFTRMPQPQVTQARLGALQWGINLEQVFGKDRREVFGGRRHRQPAARVDAFKLRGAPMQDAPLPVVDQALAMQVLVEALVNAPVRGFLADEVFDLGRKTLALRRVKRGLVEPGHAQLHGVDEDLSYQGFCLPVPEQI